MHESLIRLLEVAGTNSKSKIARDLNIGPSTVTNWGKRGVSKEGALTAADIYNSDANYILADTISEKSTVSAAKDLSDNAYVLNSKDDNFKIVPTDGIRRVPALNYVQAGEFYEYFDDAIADRAEPIIEQDVGNYVFWLEIDGLSMMPDFNPGDLILVDPDIQLNPGNYVVAIKEGSKTVTFKKWRPRGFDDNRSEYCELVPSNPDFPLIDSRYIAFEICGVGIEFSKRLR